MLKTQATMALADALSAEMAGPRPSGERPSGSAAPVSVGVMASRT